jgi:hypothetical protein
MFREGKQRLYVQVTKTQTVPMQIESEQMQDQLAWNQEEQKSQRKRSSQVLNVGAAPTYERLYEEKWEQQHERPGDGLEHAQIKVAEAASMIEEKKKGKVSGADAITSGRQLCHRTEGAVQGADYCAVHVLERSALG